MDELIEALQILAKYGTPSRPTHCEHDTLMINPEIKPSSVTKKDKRRLNKLGFFIDNCNGEKCYTSYRFGSA